MHDDILIIESLTKKYGDKVAVDNLSLRIKRGMFFGLLGPNGAGKSTTIKCITGIGKITSGTITIDGLDVEKDYKLARGKVGLSPQDFNVDFFGTCEKNLDYMAGYYGIRKEVREKRVNALLKRFDLEEHRKKKFDQLSGGLKRRLVLARALVNEPVLLILDEPTAGIDVEQRLALWGYLKELNQAGTTIILTSHYLEEVEHLCTDIAIINHGKIVAAGTKDEFVKDGSTLEEKYLSITKGDDSSLRTKN
jgi:ABC-2 type transport system ATP-binding protein